MTLQQLFWDSDHTNPKRKHSLWTW